MENEAISKDFNYCDNSAKHEENELSTKDAVSLRSIRIKNDDNS